MIGAIGAVNSINGSKNSSNVTKISFEAQTSAKKIADEILSLRSKLGKKPKDLFKYTTYKSGDETMEALRDEMGLGFIGIHGLENKLSRTRNKLLKKVQALEAKQAKKAAKS